MKKITFRIFLGAIILFCSCRTNETEINRLLHSNKASDIVRAYYLIGESGNSKYIKNIFKETMDSRISHASQFYGISVYQSKMVAMSKISGLKPPKEISYLPDSSVIVFYKDWAIKKGFINKKQH
jgi:hypothetical protein